MATKRMRQRLLRIARFRRAWILPSWFLSVLLHAAIVLAIGLTLQLWPGAPAGFGGQGSGDGGIIVDGGDTTYLGDGTEAGSSGGGGPDIDSVEILPMETENPAPQAVPVPTAAIPSTPTVVEPSNSGIGVGTVFPSTVQADARTLIQSGNGLSGRRGPGAGGDGTGTGLGGTGTGSGNAGVGGGLPGATFLGARDNGTRVVFAIDCSASMANYGAMRSAKAALVSSLQTLSDAQQFQIVFYNQQPRLLSIRGDTELIFATEVNKTLARQYISGVDPDQGTDHIPALKLALRLGPEVLFFLTDADEPQLSAAELNEIHQTNKGRTRIHTIEFGIGGGVDVDNFLKKLARQNGGTYRYFDVKRIAQQ